MASPTHKQATETAWRAGKNHFHQKPISSKTAHHQKPLSSQIPLKGDRTKRAWVPKKIWCESVAGARFLGFNRPSCGASPAEGRPAMFHMSVGRIWRKNESSMIFRSLEWAVKCSPGGFLASRTSCTPISAVCQNMDTSFV